MFEIELCGKGIWGSQVKSIQLHGIKIQASLPSTQNIHFILDMLILINI